jgi:hypothetical protein
LLTQEVEVADGATALDALKATGLDVTLQNSSMGPYLTGIDGLDAASLGAQSGWIFQVNGQTGSTGVNQTSLKSGDQLTFKFVLSYAEM